MADYQLVNKDNIVIRGDTITRVIVPRLTNSIRVITLFGLTNIESLEFLYDLPELTSLEIIDCPKVTKFDLTKLSSKIEILKLERLLKLDFELGESVKHMTNLSYLTVNNCLNCLVETNLPKSLLFVDLRTLDNMTTITPLIECESLGFIRLRYIYNVMDLSGLVKLPKLKTLTTVDLPIEIDWSFVKEIKSLLKWRVLQTISIDEDELTL